MRALEPPEKIPPIVPAQPPLGAVDHVEEEDLHGQSLEPQEELGSLAFIDSDAESIVMLNGSSHNEEDEVVAKKSHGTDDSSPPQSHPSSLPVAAVSHQGMSDGSHPSSAVHSNTLPLCGGGSPTRVLVPDSIKTVKKCPENKSTDHYTRRRRKRREGRVLGVGGGTDDSC